MSMTFVPGRGAMWIVAWSATGVCRGSTHTIAGGVGPASRSRIRLQSTAWVSAMLCPYRQITSAWSPDGRRIAYVDEDPSLTRSTVMIVSSDGLGAVDSIPIASSSIRLNQWSAQGARLVAHDMPTPHALFLNVEGADRRPRSRAPDSR